MNIVRQKNIGGGVLLMGTAQGSLADLHVHERERLSPRANAKRRDDFIAGRLFAKEALRRACGPGEWIIDRDVGIYEGAPIVIGPREAYVSISHVDGWVTAIASTAEVAVDLVKLEPLPEALCEEAFTLAEREAWRRSGANAMSIAFAAKEAALKWLHTGMGTALQALQVFPRADACLDIVLDSHTQTLAYETVTHDSWLSLVLYSRSDS